MKLGLKKTKSFLKPPSFFHRIGRDPYLDWQIVILAALVGTVCMVLVGFMQFRTVVSGMREVLLAERSPGSRALLDIQTLNAVINNFNQRAQETRELSTGFNGVRDPSQ